MYPEVAVCTGFYLVAVCTRFYQREAVCRGFIPKACAVVDLEFKAP